MEQEEKKDVLEIEESEPVEETAPQETDSSDEGELLSRTAKKHEGRVLDMAANDSSSIQSIDKERHDLWEQYPQEIRGSEFTCKGNVVYNKYVEIDLDQRNGDFTKIIE